MTVKPPRPSEGVLLTGFSLSWMTPLCVVLPLPTVLRLLVVVLFVLVVPGAAVVSRLRLDDRVVEWALTVTASVVAFAGGAVLMAWTGLWHPHALVLGLAAVCAVPLWRELRARWSATSPVPAGD